MERERYRERERKREKERKRERERECVCVILILLYTCIYCDNHCDNYPGSLFSFFTNMHAMIPPISTCSPSQTDIHTHPIPADYLGLI